VEKIKRAENILIRGVNWIGDAVITLPAIRSIRRTYPEARIDLLVKPWVYDIFKGNPYIDEIILYDKGRLKLIRELRKRHFDMAILLQNAFDAALITWLAGIPERIGYKRDIRGPLLTHAISVDKSTERRHQVYYYLDLLNSIGIKTEDEQPYLHLLYEEREDARELLKKAFGEDDESPIIGINPGATYGPAKRWPVERFSYLVSRAIEELNARIVIFGSPSEVELANEIINSASRIMHHVSRILNMSGKTNLRELASLISACDVFVTNDTGPMHMASALFVPTVAIFGSTDPAITAPFGEGHRVVTKNLPCSPCLKRECPEGHLRCMNEISVDDVLNVLKELLPVNRAVFLDRDGTLIEDRNYLNSFDGLHILPDIKEGLIKLKSKGFKLIGITNQSGIARGIVDESFIKESNKYLMREMGIDDFYYCPHHPNEHCSCRKPEPKLILQARLRHRINLRKSFVIGDRASDIMLAKQVGAKGILISQDIPNTSAHFVAKNITEAVEWVKTCTS
jgi:heptosyltransferase-2